MHTWTGLRTVVEAVATAAMIGLAAAGCATTDRPPAATGTVITYVGELAGTDALVAVAESGTQVVAYACDSKNIAWWFTGPVDSDQRFDLTGHSGAELAGSPTNNGLTLTLTAPDGSTHTATATPATGDAGLYFTDKVIDGIHYTGGWILKSARVQRGTCKTARDSTPARAP
jgi:hypothetical protein